MKTLKQMLRTGIMGIGLLSLIGVGGCKTTPQGDAFINFMGHVAAKTLVEEGIKKEIGHTDYQKKEEKPLDGTGSKFVPQSEYQEKTDYHYDYETGKIVTTWVPLPKSYTCNDLEDKNGDGYIGGDELIGLSNYFECKKQNESVRVIGGSSWKDVKGKSIIGKIMDEDTKEIVKIDQDVMPGYAGARWVYLDFHKSNNNFGIKQYIIEWYLDGRLCSDKTINFFVDYGKNLKKR